MTIVGNVDRPFDGESSVAPPPWFRGLRTASMAASTVAVGLAAGFFFAYQISVTRGLAEVGDDAYIETFQAINATVRNMWFGLVFFGSVPLLCAAVALNFSNGVRRRWLLIASLALYVATLAITAVGNVPLNAELAVVTAGSANAVAAARADFEGPWNTLNLLRTLTCLGALVAVSLASRSVGRSDCATDTASPSTS